MEALGMGSAYAPMPSMPIDYITNSIYALAGNDEARELATDMLADAKDNTV